MTARPRSAASIAPDAVDLACRFGPLALAHPVMTASGCFAYGEQFAAFMDLRKLAGLSTKGISPKPRPGNPLPRICETASGMINSIGLENVGADAFLAEKLPFLADLGMSVWVNFFGEDFDGYVECARALDAGRGRGIDALEMNISCPNIKKGGQEFGTQPAVARDLVRACRAATALPLWVKLTPPESMASLGAVTTDTPRAARRLPSAGCRSAHRARRRRRKPARCCTRSGRDASAPGWRSRGRPRSRTPSAPRAR